MYSNNIKLNKVFSFDALHLKSSVVHSYGPIIGPLAAVHITNQPDKCRKANVIMRPFHKRTKLFISEQALNCWSLFLCCFFISWQEIGWTISIRSIIIYLPVWLLIVMMLRLCSNLAWYFFITESEILENGLKCIKGCPLISFDLFIYQMNSVKCIEMTCRVNLCIMIMIMMIMTVIVCFVFLLLSCVINLTFHWDKCDFINRWWSRVKWFLFLNWLIQSSFQSSMSVDGFSAYPFPSIKQRNQ